MALFTRRDRIAIACISALILAGWGVRLLLLPKAPQDVRIIRGAVSPPALFNPADSLAAKKAGESLLIDINAADAALLETLPMIGPVKAADIIQYREQHGRFLKPSDIMKVKGIGPGTYEKIEKRITAGNP
ncbi:MAG: ComEA family DNA-binding protein [Candidatus Latescibacter sp.]|nr:ComEA family DNA-binding protein [Candidatus Latescibacter sp.]